jgi:hypothetical protein
MHISFDKDIHAADPVQLHFFVLVQPPVAHLGQVLAACLELLVAFSKNGILVETRGQPQTLLAFDP